MTQKSKGREKNKIKTKSRKIVSITAGILSTLIFIFAVCIFAGVLLSRANGSSPRIFGYSFHVVMSDSMTPEINVKDLVIAKRIEISEIKVGDDVVYLSRNPKEKGMMIVHRVFQINEDSSLVMSGIKEGATPDFEYPVYEPFGKVVGTNAFFGNIFYLLQDGRNIIFFLILIIFLIVVIYQVISIIQAVRDKKNKDEIMRLAKDELEKELRLNLEKEDADKEETDIGKSGLSNNVNIDGEKEDFDKEETDIGKSGLSNNVNIDGEKEDFDKEETDIGKSGLSNNVNIDGEKEKSDQTIQTHAK